MSNKKQNTTHVARWQAEYEDSGTPEKPREVFFRAIEEVAPEVLDDAAGQLLTPFLTALAEENVSVQEFIAFAGTGLWSMLRTGRAGSIDSSVSGETQPGA